MTSLVSPTTDTNTELVSAKKLLSTKILDIIPWTISIKFWGSFASFTTHDSKVDTRTYDYPTVAAMRGMLEAIYFKTLKDVGNIPAFRYQIINVALSKHPCPELSSQPLERQLIGYNGINHVLNAKREIRSFPISPSRKRFQRSTEVLLDPCFIITTRLAEFAIDNPAFKAKHMKILERRLQRRRCFHTPVFGKSKCFASFATISDEDRIIPYNPDPEEVMLYDWAYNEHGIRQHALYFIANVKDGVLHCDRQKACNIFGTKPIKVFKGAGINA